MYGAYSAAMMTSGSVSSAQPTMSSIGFVECGSLKTCSKKNSVNPGQSARQWLAL